MVIDEMTIKKQIRELNFSNLYLICGNEPYLKQYYSDKICEKAVQKDFADFNFHIFDGEKSTLKEISDCIDALPMMDERTCVVVKDMPLDKMGESQKKDLETIISDIPDTTVAVFLLQNISFDGKKDPKWEKVMNLFSKYGDVVLLNKKTLSDLCKLVMSGAEKRNSKISRQCAEYFINTVGDDMNNLLNELEKLCYYCNGKEIDKQAIDEIAVKSVSARIFDLTNELLSGRHEKAFSILNSLISMKEEPIVINSQLISAYVDMYRVKIFTAAGHKSEDVGDYYNYRNRSFVLRNANQNASKISAEQLRRCLDILADSDEKLKSTSVNKQIILEETLIRLMLCANGEKVRI